MHVSPVLDRTAVLLRVVYRGHARRADVDVAPSLVASVQLGSRATRFLAHKLTHSG